MKYNLTEVSLIFFLVLGLSSDSLSEDVCTHLGYKLAKRLGKPVQVSYNLPEDQITVSEVEKQLFGLIKQSPEAF